MRKIPSIFVRDFNGDPSLVTRERHPDCGWIFDGEGRATVKRDGTACMVRNGRFFRRYDAKRGKTPPVGFEPCGEPDPKTGHHPGWLPVGDGPEDRWLREAFAFHPTKPADGTYEACGPKIQGNPEHQERHVLFRHGAEEIPDAPTYFDALASWFVGKDFEGIVWHHADGRMAKIKASDFGLSRANSGSMAEVR